MTPLERAIETCTWWVMRGRVVALVATLLIAGIASYGLHNLRINESWRVFFQEGNPQFQAFKALEQEYTRIDNIFLGFALRQGGVFTVAALRALHDLTESAWRIPFATRVDSITNFQYSRADGDDIMVSDLVEDPESLTPDDLERIRNVALHEPLLVHRVISEDGQVAGVNITFRIPEDAVADGHDKAVAAVRDLSNRIETEYPGVKLYATGMLMLNNAFKEAALSDFRRLMPIMYAAILVIVYLFVRSVAGTVVTMLVVALSTATAEGVAGWLGINLTAPATIVPPLIMTLAVADSIHILTVFRREMDKGLEKRDAMIRSLQVNMTPVFLTSLTTIIGFLCLNFSDSPPLWDVGNITSIGVAAAFVYSVVLIPALIAWLPVRTGRRARIPRWPNRLAAFVTAHRRRLALISTLCVVIALILIPRNELNDQPLEYFDKQRPFRQASEFVIDTIGGAAVIEYSIESGEPNGVADPEYLAKVEAFAHWYRQQPGVVHVNAITDTFKRLNKNMHGDDPDYYRVPNNRELAAQYLLFYEMSLPFGLDLTNRINLEKSASRFLVITEYISSRELRTLAEAGSQWLRNNAPEPMHALASGSALMFAHLAERNIREMVAGTLLAMSLIAVVLVLSLRSLKYGSISLVPNLVPQILAFGLWGVLVGNVSFALSTVSSMSLGIVVDDTVHFVTHYVRARRHQKTSAPAAVRHSFTTVGPALLATTVILSTGFLILALSNFSFNRDMALLSAIVVACAALADGLYLPPLLLLLDAKKNHQEQERDSNVESE